MKFALLCLVCLGAQVKAADHAQVILEEFRLFKLQYGKTYANPTEEEFRMNIYSENRELIALHNQLYYKGLVNYTMAINQFGDLLHTEYVDRLNSYANVSNSTSTGSTLLRPSNVVPPDTLDWRTKGYVTPVKNQGDCNCSYAFAAIGALEGQQFKIQRQLVSLSAQDIVDCSVKEGNQGCKGGNVEASYQYIMHGHGIESEESYPYTGQEDECKHDPDKSVARIVFYGKVFPPNEKSLLPLVAANGPIAVNIDASHDSFRFYSQGVYYEEQCSTTDTNHSMLAVGYDTDAKGGDYWIVKNSWGEAWGEKGYIKMARNRNNNCGVASDATIPFNHPW